ncbi:MAG TPA: DUF2442 domain-containing protein [Rhodothermales bacterium]
MRRLEHAMPSEIIGAKHLGGYRVHLTFEDGVEGEIDLASVIRFTGVFAPLRDQAEFAKLRVDPESGTIVWPNGADIDPDVLYAAVTGHPIEVIDPAAEAAHRLARLGGTEPDLKPIPRRRPDEDMI